MTTVGVAIAIPEPWAGQLQQSRASFGDRQAEAIPTHITLVPPTRVDSGLDEVMEHLEKAASSFAPFPLRLRGTATFWPTSPVVFIALSQGISACELLAEAVRRGPLDQQLSFPFHPHVTVAHDVDRDALEQAYESLKDFEAAFVVHRFQLFVHGDDEVWRSLRSFELTGRPADRLTG